MELFGQSNKKGTQYQNRLWDREVSVFLKEIAENWLHKSWTSHPKAITTDQSCKKVERGKMERVREEGLLERVLYCYEICLKETSERHWSGIVLSDWNVFSVAAGQNAQMSDCPGNVEVSEMSWWTVGHCVKKSGQLRIALTLQSLPGQSQEKDFGKKFICLTCFLWQPASKMAPNGPWAENACFL